MSSFKCEHCGTDCLDSPHGYTTGCEHYPADSRTKRDFNRWGSRSRYHDHSRSPLPNTLGLHEGQFVWILTSFREVLLEQVSRVTPQFAWCGSKIKIRLSNGLVEMPKLHWHGRAFTSLEAAEKGEMPMTLKQFRLLVALGEKPEELYTKDIAWASQKIEEIPLSAVPDWGRLRGVVL